MTRIELEKYLCAMAESGHLVNSIIIDGVTCPEDKVPVENYVRKVMGSLDQVDVIRPTHEKPFYQKEEIRIQIADNVVLKPYGRPYKFYLIEADLIREDGQSILLKTLEEPPEYAIFILYTRNSELLLETIRSRCLILKLGETGSQGVITPELVSEIRSIGAALPFGSQAEGMKACKRFLEINDSEQGTFGEIFDIIIRLYTEVLVSKVKGPCPVDAGRLSQLDEKVLLRDIDALKMCRRYIDVTVNKDVALGELIYKMRS